MDVMDRESADLGNLFQLIITDMKNTSPLWEDFIAKANKLHACLRAAIQAIAVYLDAFQKIADAATNSRGASKEIGTALTRVCLRHKAVETKMKTFTTAIMDYLITPLQDKLEEWRRQVVVLDKEHAKEYKRCRTELKKHSSDTLRLQKKARKGQSEAIQSMVDSQMQNVTIRRAELEEVERKSLRAAMIQERIRYCSFVNMLQPVVKEECEVISELGHLQEAMQSIAVITKESNILPQSIEEIILESTSTINFYPESPGGNSGSQICSSSLGSRKTSICSISSINSSGSNGSPGHHYQKPVSQLFSPLIHKCSESSDSGFSSSPALAWQAPPPTGPSHATSTWPPQSPDVVQTTDRPHTISSTYEKGHQRPAITVYTFQNPQETSEVKKVPPTMPCRPPLPVRCSSLERPSPLSTTAQKTSSADSIQKQCPSPIPTHIAKEFQQQPTYVNMSELASLAAMKVTHQHIKQNSYPRASSDSIEFDAQSTPVQTSSNFPSGSNNQTQSSQSNILRSKISSNLSGITSSKSISPQSSLRYSSSQSKSSPKIPLTNTIVRLTATEATTSDDSTDYTRKEANVKTTTEFCHTISSDPKSPNLTDDKSRGSVLEKTSMFEKLEQKQTSNSFSLPLTSAKCLQSAACTDSVHCSRKKDTSSTSTPTDSDADQFYEDSIQELNNLIGELDLFQREFETKEEETTKFKMSKRCKSDDGNIPTQANVYSDCNQTSNINLNSSMLSMDANNFKLTLSDSDLSRCVSDSSSQLSENHTFSRFDRNIEENYTNKYCTDGNDHTTIFNHTSDLDIDYIRSNSEIMIVQNNGSSTPKNSHCSETNPKLMSFRSDKQLSPVVQKRQQSIKQKKTKSLDPIEFNEVAESNEMIAPLTSSKGNVSDRLRPKPTILPRPASLSGCTISKTAQRSSLNNKPLPPVRRSSSITPSPNITDAHSNQQNTSHSVVENFPPPPAYLLDRTTTSSPTINVAETIKALTVINHTPASPSAIRRALAQSNQTPSPPQHFGAKKPSSSPIYVQPKQPAKMSSFKCPNTGCSTLGQKPSRISAMKPVYQSTLQHTESDNYHYFQKDNKSILQCTQKTDAPASIYPSHGEYVHHDRVYSKMETRSYPETQFYQSIQCNDYGISNVEKSENISRVRTEFLDNLNAKLSRRAFAVRSLINSKALPDPRLCHESLMDQIKRGTRLKPNRTINDRSAPKII